MAGSRVARAMSTALALGCVSRVAAVPDEYPWFLIDHTSVVCTSADPPAPGVAKFEFDSDYYIDPADIHTPHIFTIFRASNSSVTVSFNVKDAEGKLVAQATEVALEAMTDRRLDSRSPEDMQALDSFIEGLPSGPMEEPQERRLATRRRGVSSGGSSFSSPRRRRSASGGVSTDIRRRANSAVARRRGYTGSYSGQPMRGAYGTRFVSGNGDAYGYTDEVRLGNQYAGNEFSQPSYGYSGRANWGDGSSVVLATTAGIAVGAGATYTYSRWATKDECTFGDEQMTCQQCRDTYGTASCNFVVDGVANRDDFMNTGFWPADYTGPYTVTITQIEGDDFTADKVCPPAEGWLEHEGQNIYLSLTTTTELGDELEEDIDMTPVLAGAAVAFMCCMTCFCVIFYCWCCRNKKSDDKNSGYPVQGEGMVYGQAGGQQGYVPGQMPDAPPRTGSAPSMN